MVPYGVTVYLEGMFEFSLSYQHISGNSQKHYTIDMKLHPYNYLSTSSEQVESHPQSRFSSDKRRSRWNLIFNFNCYNICGLFLLATVEKVIYLSVQRKISTTFNPQINKLTGREDRSIK